MARAARRAVASRQQHLSKLRRERRGRARDRELLKRLAGRTDLRLNFGSSSQHLEGWISIDLKPDPEGICFTMDATRPWPFEPGSAEAINSEHFIEHLSLDEARAYFEHAFRVLRPGGVIRTSTPSLVGICETYGAADPDALEAHRRHGYTARTHGEMLNNYFFQWGHRHIYDFETLQVMLTEAGFIEVRQVAYGESTHPVLKGVDRHDMTPLRQLSIAVDAVKPPATRPA
jgi:predicted SAM-dependent methyltransferase